MFVDVWRTAKVALVTFLHCVFAVGCGADDTVRVVIAGDDGPVTFEVEIADSPEERTRGLMFRQSLPADAGMLFLYPVEQPLSFWMKDTLIPLDMIFIRADRTILGIVENAEPQTLTFRSVPGLSQFVLEVNGGLAADRGIAPDQVVDFSAQIPVR